MSNVYAAIHGMIPTWTLVKASWGIRLDNSNVPQNVTP